MLSYSRAGPRRPKDVNILMEGKGVVIKCHRKPGFAESFPVGCRDKEVPLAVQSDFLFYSISDNLRRRLVARFLNMLCRANDRWRRKTSAILLLRRGKIPHLRQ